MAVARGKKKEDEVIKVGDVKIISDDLETKLQNNLKSPNKDEVKADLGGVSLVVEEKVEPPVKMVKVLMKENHKCCIGGEWYYLLKDKHYNVPVNVKEVLLKANKLLPL